MTIAVIGAGLSGSLLAVNLLQRCGPDDRILLIEKRAGFGRGLAYSTTNPNHLLNVRAENMSAFHDRPDDFISWLRERAGSRGDAPPVGNAFVSRQVYGTYIRALLCDQLWTRGRGRNLALVPDEVRTLAEDDSGLTLTTASGRIYRADLAVIASGNLPPDQTVGAYIGNPWDPAAIDDLPPEAPVLLVGTGLTMVDTVQSLLDAGHRGPIRAVSRRGLLPRTHAPTRPLPTDARALPRTTSIPRLTQWLRARIRTAAADGIGWRSVIDGIRPHLQDLWRRLPIEERRRFLRHLRPWWDVHRHRLAPDVAAMLDTVMRRGQLTVHAARILSLDPTTIGVTTVIRHRGTNRTERVQVARAINCSGPENNYFATTDPLLRHLIEHGVVRPDPLGLGLEVTDHGALINAEGRPSRRLFGLGPITRGTFWEVVAVPDIRFHCARLAGHLLSLSEIDVFGAGMRRRSARHTTPAIERLTPS